jgi:hypothetical protein
MIAEAGTLVASVDDGTTWASQSVEIDDDFYAIAFFDAQRARSARMAPRI